MTRKPRTRRYMVSGYVTMNVMKEIEASSKEAARKVFEETLGLPGLCWQCSSAGADTPDCVGLNGFDDTITATEVEAL